MKLLNILGGLVLAATATLSQQVRSRWGYLNEMGRGNTLASFRQTKPEFYGRSMDVPRIYDRPNITNFEWWYFDAVNPANVNESIVVIFYLATNYSFPLRPSDNSSVSVDVFLNFADGSSFPLLIDAAPSKGKEDLAAVLATDGDVGTLGTSGNWTSTGATFQAYPDTYRYIVKVDSPRWGIKGSLDIHAVAPDHFPCSIGSNATRRGDIGGEADAEGESVEAASHIGWTNLISDGDAEVDFTFKTKEATKELKFSKGLGYHDHKWGDRPFHWSVKDWYWGHARVGGYSFVWLYTENHYNQTFSNAYIYHGPTKGYRVSCKSNLKPESQPTFIKIQNFPDSSQVSFQFEDVPLITLDLKKTKVLSQHGPFTRWSGKAYVSGSGVKFDGTALFQEFHFGPFR